MQVDSDFPSTEKPWKLLSTLFCLQVWVYARKLCTQQIKTNLIAQDPELAGAHD